MLEGIFFLSYVFSASCTKNTNKQSDSKAFGLKRNEELVCMFKESFGLKNIPTKYCFNECANEQMKIQVLLNFITIFSVNMHRIVPHTNHKE